MRSLPLVPATGALFAEGTCHFEILPALLSCQRAAPALPRGHIQHHQLYITVTALQRALSEIPVSGSQLHTQGLCGLGFSSKSPSINPPEQGRGAGSCSFTASPIHSVRGSRAEPLREPGLPLGLFCCRKRLNPGERPMAAMLMKDPCYHVCAQRAKVLARFATEWQFHLQAEMGSGFSKSTKTGSFSLLIGPAAGPNSPEGS